MTDAPQPLPPEVLVELEGLLNDASLPWYAAGDGDWIACAERPLDQGDIVCENPGNDCERSRRHWPKRRALIAAAVNNLPALISTARSTEAMRAENERLSKERDEFRAAVISLQKRCNRHRTNAANWEAAKDAAEHSLKAAREALENVPKLPPAFQWTGTEDGLEDLFDAGMRHKTNVPFEYLKRWLPMFRPFAYATHDDSWGELEKLICITLHSYVQTLAKVERVLSTITPTGDEDV